MSGTRRTVAVTGGTGFLGRQVVAALLARGWHVRLLARREPVLGIAPDAVPDVVLGSLAEPAALERLVGGVDAVIHLAGLIKARDDAAFMAVNRDGTRALAGAVASHAPNAHVVLISSLAARAPELSGYAASKRAGEDAALEVLGPSRLSIIRPPAIYGPGDRETLVFFELAQRALIPLPRRPAARFALIHVEDAAATIAGCLDRAPTGQIHALSDAVPAGYAWRDILLTAAEAVENRTPRFVPVPATLLGAVGRVLGAVSQIGGPVGMVNAGKIRELLHEDWAVHGDERLHLPEVQCRYALSEGFRQTALWYRRAGWL